MLETLQAFFTQDASLWSLLAGSFVAATLVPVSSELMLFAVLSLHPGLAWGAVAVATLGNTDAASYGITAKGCKIVAFAQGGQQLWRKLIP